MNTQETSQLDNPKKKSLWKKNMWVFTKLVAVVLVVSFLVRGFLFTNYIVYGQSMMPTIHDGERIIVNKIGYEITEPNRFDLIIFHATEDSDYIKRVIGLPGDEIYYDDDTLYINDEAHDEHFLKVHKEDHDHGLFTENFNLEEMTGETTVPEGYVFVLGDNRQNSVDSRHIGFVPVEEIVGQANMAFWPPKNIRFFK
ncbi:signal peptidase I [Salipaludibacillus keqinensis]|uniref:Signal peptidase I n=1 Tax=Salipaludibacillus keqinensis TaxID=2045207 RepID=A0A323TMR8_9BACI|nr:signal peptidase I [Salipaludibacillus keqinensis]PYZ93993.1 signal peptidase I [Salipaludibacillus keqinensis]